MHAVKREAFFYVLNRIWYCRSVGYNAGRLDGLHLLRRIRGSIEKLP